jgi:hypothetical protein
MCQDIKILQCRYGKTSTWFFRIGISLCIIIILGPATAQQNINTQIPGGLQRGQNIVQFFTKDETIGSSFLAKNWIKGNVELWNHRKIPTSEQPLLFNFEKTDNMIYTVNKDNQIVTYPADSVLSFNLVDDNGILSFEKLNWVSTSFFLMPILKSAKGYSLYKRLFTKFLRADYSNEGYYTKGRKFDEYVDYYEYYITYPGNNLFRKLYLREKDIRRALKEESKLLDDFFERHDHEVNEQSLIGLVQFIDDRKFPE